jgi:hypothetical protein
MVRADIPLTLLRDQACYLSCCHAAYVPRKQLLPTQNATLTKSEQTRPVTTFPHPYLMSLTVADFSKTFGSPEGIKR